MEVLGSRRRTGRTCPEFPGSPRVLFLLVAFLDLLARLGTQLTPFGFLRGVEHRLDL